MSNKTIIFIKTSHCRLQSRTLQRFGSSGLSIEFDPQHEDLLRLPHISLPPEPLRPAAVLQSPPVAEGGVPGPGRTGPVLVDGPEVVSGLGLRLTSRQEEDPGDRGGDVATEGWADISLPGRVRQFTN